MAAIVAADVAGYSRLMGLDEVGTARKLRSSALGPMRWQINSVNYFIWFDYRDG